ncbi:hypothetical protein KVR01_004331 [Diaporthe batatas]|uniref:uncharacterized protein n=1 Tax=Diaporthe batatas TaxID=748121 RepID=UPI001D0550BA|nr:uncharacterized protein KVR01_004331 [Diaporthe batatas]KAG8165779.1 hypothetical protein KVR01_004331 [Diaporthe batatas]
MPRLATILGAVLLALVGIAAGHPVRPSVTARAHSSPVHRSVGLGRDTVREDDRLERRDFTWANSETPQNLCGDSTFATSEEDQGPLVSHCKTFLDYVKDRDGFWLVTRFSSPDSWEEFARVESCVVAVRHTDRVTGTIPIGNQDVSDIIKSVISQFGEGVERLPSVRGRMGCDRDPSFAGVEWKVYKA